MKVLMINDCAFVGETILKYLPESFERIHIKRSRRLWSKTLGIAFKILISKGDVYHANYLLQDCYVALKLRKRPLVGHAHGSDLRDNLKNSLWKKIVQYNLKKCDKVLVSTPDILKFARRYRKDAEYIPNPVDMQLFYPKPLPERGKKLKILIAGSSDWTLKGTDIAIRALNKIKDKVEVSIINYGKDFEKTISLAESLGLDVHPLPKIPHEEIRKYYWRSDIVMDRFKLGSLGMVSLEAIASGRPVVTYVSSEYEEYEDFPLKDVDTEEKIIEAISNATPDLWKEQCEYLKKNHDPEKIANRIREIYETLKNVP